MKNKDDNINKYLIPPAGLGKNYMKWAEILITAFLRVLDELRVFNKYGTAEALSRVITIAASMIAALGYESEERIEIQNMANGDLATEYAEEQNNHVQR